MARHCRCTPENNPCGYCLRDITRREIDGLEPDGGDQQDGSAAAERFYEKHLDRIGGSRD